MEKQEEFELSDLSECRIDPVRVCFPRLLCLIFWVEKNKMCMDNMGVHLSPWNNVFEFVSMCDCVLPRFRHGRTQGR